MDQLDLKNAVIVGYSTSAGEVARYIGRHGTKRVAKAVLISAIPLLPDVFPSSQFVKSLVQSGRRKWRQLPITEE